MDMYNRQKKSTKDKEIGVQLLQRCFVKHGYGYMELAE